MLAEQLGVLHDRVGAEVGQPSCVGLRVITRGAVRRRAPGPPLVQHQHAEVPERAWQPAGRARHADRPGGLKARAALKEQQVGPVATVGRRDFPSKDLEGLPRGVLVVERNGQRVLGDEHARAAELSGHDAALPQPRRRPNH